MSAAPYREALGRPPASRNREQPMRRGGPGFIWTASFHVAFARNLAIDDASVLEGFRRLVLLGGGIELLLLFPALINAAKAPFGAAPRGAYGSVADDHEDRVRVRGRVQ